MTGTAKILRKLTLLPISRLAAKQTITLKHVLNVTFSLFQMAAGVTGPLGHPVPSLAMATLATQALKQGKSMNFTSKEYFCRLVLTNENGPGPV